VKHLRTFILVLLAVLLPIRGAVAAALLCPGGVKTDVTVVVGEHGHYAQHLDHGTPMDHSASHEHHSASHDEAHDATTGDESATGGGTGTCQFCASGCCMASMVGSVPSLGQPVVTGSAVFPMLAVPVAAFQSDGQDRPPRTT